MNHAHARRFLTWTLTTDKPTSARCNVLGNSMLPHSKDKMAVAVAIKDDGKRVAVCECCRNHIAATHWLREHGQEPSESKIATVSLPLSGRWEIMQRQGYQRNAIMHFVRILEGLGHVTRDEKTVCAGQVTRREVSFRMISPS